jgi:glucan phosphoethanolaminetransferase (alkaline phosphatase superfamily)
MTHGIFIAGAALRLATVALGLSLPFSSACTRHPSSQPPFVMLAVLDTTRADHLPIYGAERPSAPALTALAAQGVVFERAIASACALGYVGDGR